MTSEQIAQAIAAKMVKPLEWQAGERDQRRADSILGEFCVTFFGGKWFYQGEPHKGMLEAKSAAQADYTARMIAGMDLTVVVGLVEALLLADAALSGANMNMTVVEKSVKTFLREAGVEV